MTTSDSPRARFALLWAIGSLFYLTTLPQHLTYDGLCYALDVERAPLANLYHANHLLYSVAQRALWLASHALGWKGPALPVMQAVNAVAAGLAVALLYRRLRRFGEPVALAAASLFAVSSGFWQQAGDPGCYAWAAVATIALTSLLVESAEVPAFRIGVLHGTAVLFHQMLLLAAPAFLWQVRRRGPRAMGAYLCGIATLLIGVYGLVAWRFHGGSLGEALYWALGPAGPPADHPSVLGTYWWRWGVAGNLRPAFDAFVHVWIAPTRPWLDAIAGILLLVLVLGVAWRTLRAPPPGLPRETVQSLWLWVLTLNAFQFFFWVGTVHYRLLFLPPLLLLAVSAVRSFSASARAAAVGCLAALLLWNWTALVKPRHGLWPDRLRSRWVAQQVGPRDFFLYRGRGDQSILNVALAYFAPEVPGRSLYGYFMATPSGDVEPMKSAAVEAAKAGGRFWIEESLLDPSALAGMPETARDLQAWLRKAAARQRVVAPDGYAIIDLSPGAR